MSATNTAPSDTDRDVLTIAEYAARRGVTERTVRRLIEAGDVPAFRVGSRLWRIPLAFAEREVAEALAAAESAGDDGLPGLTAA